MQFGVCLPSQYALLAASMGYDFVELRAAELAPEGPVEQFYVTQKNVDRAGIPALSYNFLLPADLALVGPAPQLDRLRRYVGTLAERAAVLGGRFLVLGSGGARRVPQGFSRDRAVAQFQAAARTAGEAAARHGLTVVLEPLNHCETNLLHTVAEGAEWARLISHPGVALLADVYHMHMEREPLHHLLASLDMIKHVHVCDYARGVPGSAGLDLGAVFIHLSAGGYQGGVSVEASFRAFETEGPAALEVLRHASSCTGQVTFAP